MTYRIKTAVRLTGIPRNTLLAWERRYEVVSPSRADNGYRLYSDGDIARLNAVRQLMDQGYKVGEAVRLLRTAKAEDDVAVPSGVRVALVHPGMTEQLRHSDIGVTAVRVLQSVDNWMDLTIEPTGVDILVVALDRLGDDPRRSLQTALQLVGGAHALVTYSFAPQHVLQRLASAGVRLVRQPVRASQLVTAILEIMALSRGSGTAAIGLQGPPPNVSVPEAVQAPVERRFDDLEIARYAEMSSSVACECPNHLAGLVRALVDFEAYAAQCSQASPDDQVLHRWLERNTSRARHVVEEMLEEISIRDRLPL